ncbi:hypothetical protein HYW46_03865 [Candidatus Daviesbacteria bacterium]|nr:hypothetical protein [Candidatus Daviesbacteria bacterium]
MQEKDGLEGFWAVKQAEAIIRTHAQIKKLNNAIDYFPDKQPFLTGFVVGSLLTAAFLLSFRQPRPE